MKLIENLKVFFTEARSEFKKISWPDRDEIKGSTTVVCVTIACVMVLLLAYDSVIQSVFGFVLKIRER